MAEAAAEQTAYFASLEEVIPVQQLPAVIEVSQLPQNELLVSRANKFISFVGNTAVSKEVTVEETHPASLMEGIRGAKEGHEPSLKMVEANVSTDVWERTIKAGLVITTELTVDSGDKVYQHGQSMDSVQENTLRYAAD